MQFHAASVQHHHTVTHLLSKRLDPGRGHWFNQEFLPVSIGRLICNRPPLWQLVEVPKTSNPMQPDKRVSLTFL